MPIIAQTHQYQIKQRLTGLILAGGRSKRMGSDKAMLLWQGKTWLAQAEALLVKAGATKVIVSRDQNTHLTTIPDLIKDRGPLGGVYSVIKDIHGPLLIIPIDMPRLNPLCLHHLLKAAKQHNQQSICYHDSPLPFYINATQQHADLLHKILKSEDAKKSVWYFLKCINTFTLDESLDTPNFNSPQDLC